MNVNAVPTGSIAAMFFPIRHDSVQLDGVLGSRVDSIVTNNLMQLDLDAVSPKADERRWLVTRSSFRSRETIVMK